MSTSKQELRYYENGLKYCQSGELETAIAAFTKAIALAPEFAEAYSDRGGVYSLLKRYHDAEKDLKRAISLKPNLATAHLNLGTTLAKQGKFLESIPYLDEALRLGLEKVGPMALRARQELFLQAQKDGTMEKAINAFLDAASPKELEAMVTNEFPFMILPEFTESVEDSLKAILTTHKRSMLKERLGMLRRLGKGLI